MTALQSRIQRRNLLDAVREKDNCKVFSLLLKTNLKFEGSDDPDGDLESLIFGDSNDDDESGDENSVEKPSPKRILLKKLRSQLGEDLIHAAAHYGNSFIVKCLIRLEVPVDTLSNIMTTPLMTALEGQANEKTIQTLLDCGANIYHKTPYGSSILKTCVSFSLKQWRYIELILNRIKSDCSDRSAVTAEKLLKLNFMIYHAVLLRDVKILRIMLKRGCSISASDPKTRRTAFHVAVLMKDLNVIKFLLKNGADINVTDNKEMSPFTYALDYGGSTEESDILNYLLDHGSNWDLNRRNYYDQQMHILRNGRKQIVRTLLARQCVRFDRTDRLFGKSSLHYIAHNYHLMGNKSIVEYLQRRRINVNALDLKRNSPLIYAALIKNISLTKYLLQNGANVNERNTSNVSALYAASFEASLHAWRRTSMSNICKLIELLLLYGADSQLSNVNNVEHLTVIDNIVKEKSCDYLARPILAYLVLHVANGGEIAEFILPKIDSNKELLDELKLREKDLDYMREIKVNDSLTAYNLMLDDDKKIMLSTRDKEMFALLKNFYNTFSSDSYYIRLLKQRLEKIFQEVQVRQKTADILCKFFTVDYFGFPEIIDKIIDYLDNQDLHIVFHM